MKKTLVVSLILALFSTISAMPPLKKSPDSLRTQCIEHFLFSRPVLLPTLKPQFPDEVQEAIPLYCSDFFKKLIHTSPSSKTQNDTLNLHIYKCIILIHQGHRPPEKFLSDFLKKWPLLESYESGNRIFRSLVEKKIVSKHEIMTGLNTIIKEVSIKSEPVLFDIGECLIKYGLNDLSEYRFASLGYLLARHDTLSPRLQAFINTLLHHNISQEHKNAALQCAMHQLQVNQRIGYVDFVDIINTLEKHGAFINVL